MTELVTCIIPCRNGVKTIERAVKSACDVGCDNVFVYDDGSSDGTADLLHQLEQKYHQLKRFSLGIEIRAGVIFARNYLISNVTDGLIIPLDADDVLLNVSDLYAAWELGTWVYGDYIEHSYGQSNHIKGSPDGVLPRKNVTGVTFLFHKSDWAWAGGYDPDFAYAEDYAFQCALTNAGVKPKYIETVVYGRYLSPDGNPRTTRAMMYWHFFHQLARSKYQTLFAGTG